MNHSIFDSAVGFVSLIVSAISLSFSFTKKDSSTARKPRPFLVVFAVILMVIGVYFILRGCSDSPEYTGGIIEISSPGPADLDEINSKISYPKEKSYLDTYKYGVIDAPKGDSVYGYYHSKKPETGDKIYFYPEHGERVKVLAHEYYRICVIVESEQKACWINEDYIIYD